MESYDATDATMLGKYTEFMTQYADTMQKFTALEDDEMNDAEAAYYIESKCQNFSKTGDSFCKYVC